MKQLHSKRYSIGLILFFLSISYSTASRAQKDASLDSTAVVTNIANDEHSTENIKPEVPNTIQEQKAEKTRRWDKRHHQRYAGWERIKPTHVKLQYAGGMGVLSTGFGWDYGKRCQWETDLFFGYLPKKYAEKFRLTFTLKQNYIPWSMSFDEHWNLEPFYCGLYFTTIAGEEFWGKEPGRYPNHYYNISTKIRPSIFFGQRFGYNTNMHLMKNIQLWYEVGTNELYLISKVTNKSLKMKDILRFSFGLKIQLFNEKKAAR